MTSLSQAKVSEQLEFFLKGFQAADGAPKYRARIAQMIAEGKASVLVDYEDLLAFDTDLAITLIQRPDSILPAFKEAAYEAVKTENFTYADDKRDELEVRIKGITDKLPLRSVAAKYLDRLVAINGMVVRTSEVQPLALVAAFRCPNGHLTLLPQTGALLKTPTKCSECEESRNLELDKSNSKFTDYQVIRIQELPEELPPGQLPTSIDAGIIGEIVSKARPGDRIVVTGVVRAEPETAIGRGKLTVFRTRLETNYLDVSGKEPDQVQINVEDEAEIKRIAALPDAYERLINSIAPSIYGFETQKEAVLLMITGAPQGLLPDGTTIRGDLNILLVGDPGCIVADERVVLGDGRIVKIGKMGRSHLQQLQVPVLTGQGARRAMATTFHTYKDEPILEIVTESGKSIKGTYNHPLLAVGTQGRRLVREWRRLDQFRVGDRVAVVTGFPCTVKGYVDTGFTPITRNRLGPKFHGLLPSKVTPELAAFLGYMVGDGWVCKDGYRLGFVVAQPEIDLLPRLLSLAKGLFGFKRLKASETVKKGRKVHLHYVYLSDEDVAHNLAFLREKRVPDIILESGNEVAASFLRWLFEADGSVFDHGRGRRAISLKAKDIELLRDVQVLLLRFGIHSRIVGSALMIRRGESILKFAKEIGFVSDKKVARAKALAVDAGSFKRFHGQRSERIVGVLHHENADVFDIEVPEGHRFIANGIISHNTAKSELLKYVSRVSPRGLYTTGRGSTAAGLTAAVVKEKSGLMMLEAGAVVLADQGVACIDEFDKMRVEDRGVLHEVMEQQSYHPSLEVLLSSGRKVRIGEYVDSIFKLSRSRMIEGRDCQIVPLESGDEVFTYDFVNHRIDRVRIARVSRHLPPDHFVRILYSNGREIIVTPEHPVFVFRDGVIQTIRADEVNEEDFVPAPRTLPRMQSEVPSFKAVPPAGRKVVLAPSHMTPALARILGFLITEGHFYVGGTHEVGFSNTNETLLKQMERLMAEVFNIRPNLSINKGKVVTQRYISRSLYDWFLKNFPEMVHKAREKRVPPAIMGSHPGLAREFLAAAFLGDGSVEPEALCYRTASKGLAEDYQDLLLKLGVASRILRDKSNDSFKVYVTGDSLPFFASAMVEGYLPLYGRVRELVERSLSSNRRHDVVPASLASKCISIRQRLGVPYDGRYFRHLKEGHGITREVFYEDLSFVQARNDQVRSELTRTPASFRGLRVAGGLSQSAAASLIGVPRGTVDYVERGGYSATRAGMLQSKLESGLKARSVEVQDSITTLKDLLQLRFLRVKKVENVKNEGVVATKWVYDVTVEPHHDFISCGLILHNTVSVAKGGIVATLNARTSILAAANPVFGKYDPYKNIYENVNLPTPLLTRFDLVFIIRDIPDRAKDEKLASHILETHRAEAFIVQPPLNFDMLRKYLIYAKKVEPKLTREAQERLLQFYLDLRASSTEGTIAITPRQLEALIRISTARARLLLRDKVTIEDALQAINLMRKMLESVGIDVRTGKVDLGVLQGRPASERSILEKAMDVFRQLHGPEKKPVEAKAFVDELVKTGDFSAEEARRVISTLYKLGQIYEIRSGYYSKIS